MSWMKIRAMNSRTPTPAITVYWRFRYAEAPSCTAPEIVRMRSLPGDSARSCRDVTAPYTTAAAAHTSATKTPRSVRKSLKGGPPEGCRGASRAAWGAPGTGETGPRHAQVFATPKEPAQCTAGRGRYWPGTQRRPDDRAGPGSCRGGSGSEAGDPDGGGSP